MKSPIMTGGDRLILVFPLFFMLACNYDEPKYQPKTYTVRIEQMKFQPADITLHAGDTVVWINNDLVAHNVTQLPDASWQSPTLLKGQSWKQAVDKSDDYYCSIHKVMKGRLMVP